MEVFLILLVAMWLYYFIDLSANKRKLTLNKRLVNFLLTSILFIGLGGVPFFIGKQVLVECWVADAFNVNSIRLNVKLPKPHAITKTTEKYLLSLRGG